MEQRDSRPILIIQTAFIGDTILASAFARSVHERYPDSPIHFFLRKGNESVNIGLPFIHKTWVWDKQRGKVRSLWALIKELRQYEFRAIFNLHRHFNSGFITLMMRADEKIGFRQNPLSFAYSKKVEHQIPHLVEGKAWHEVQRNHQLLNAYDSGVPLELNAKKLRPALPIQPKNFEKVSVYQTRPYVVVAPASVWFTKQWEEEKYHSLVAEMSKSHQVLLIGGPDDHVLCERVKGSSSAQNLCGKLNLLDSAAVMKDAERVFVNDSGPLHLASSVNAKTTAIFCSTITDFGYGPLADDSIVLESHEKLECRPCGLHGHDACPLGHFKCSKNVLVTQLLETISFSVVKLE